VNDVLTRLAKMVTGLTEFVATIHNSNEMEEDDTFQDLVVKFVREKKRTLDLLILLRTIDVPELILASHAALRWMLNDVITDRTVRNSRSNQLLETFSPPKESCTKIVIGHCKAYLKNGFLRGVD